MIVMGRSILFLSLLAVIAVLPRAYLSYAHEWNEGQPQKYSKQLTRKEWRTLTHSEKAEWVGAIKVRPPASP
jgi:tyrosinase